MEMVMKSSLNRVLFFLVLFGAQIALGENAVTFTATGNPGYLTIEGKGGKVTGKPELKDGKVSGTFEVALSALDTGDGLRNSHMTKKYLETDKYPKAKLVLEPVALPKAGYFNWKGALTLHGETKPVSGVAFIEGSQIEAKFSVDMLDYKIKKASYLGVGVDEKIAVVVRLDLPK